MTREMKHLVVSMVSLAAVCQPLFAQYQPVPEEEKGKLITVTAQVREEYDDNVFTSGIDEVQAWRTLVEPGIILNFNPTEQTLISGRYNLGLNMWADRPGDDILDMTHDIAFRAAHTFSPRFEVDLRDRFRMAYEPSLEEGGAFRRVNGDYLTNDLSLFGSAQWTPRFGNTLEYINSYVTYDEALVGLSQDRMSHTFNLENRISILPTTVGVVGYRYNIVDYTDINKDSQGHFFLVGVDHKFSDQWIIEARTGVELRDYDSGGNSTGPYASLNSTWRYNPLSSVTFGYAYSSDLTDLSTFNSSDTHALTWSWLVGFTPKLALKIGGSYSMSSFDTNNAAEGVDISGTQHDNALNFETAVVYTINKHYSAELGYIRTELDSDFVARSYDRNRYYIGFRGIW